jgi:hypothetical protein
LTFGTEKSKKPKKLAAYQAYSHLFFDEKIKNVLEARWLAERHLEKDFEEDNPKEKPSIRFQNKVTRELYELETDDVKEEVEEYRKREADKNDTSEEDSEEGNKQKAIEKQK